MNSILIPTKEKKTSMHCFQFTIRMHCYKILILHAAKLNFGEKKLDYKIIFLLKETIKGKKRRRIHIRV